MYNIEDMESRNFRSPNSQQITIEGLQGVVAKSTLFPARVKINSALTGERERTNAVTGTIRRYIIYELLKPRDMLYNYE